MTVENLMHPPKKCNCDCCCNCQPKTYGPLPKSENNFDSLKKLGEMISEVMQKGEKKAEAERKQAQEKAMFEAMKRWNQSATTGESSYLSRKKVQPHGVRYLNDEPDAMLLPIGDFGDKVFVLQIIRGKNKKPNSLDKEFWPSGMAKKGHGHLIKKMIPSILVKCSYFSRPQANVSASIIA